MSIDAWSWSRFERYETCPAQFKYKFIQKRTETPSPAMVRGDKIHKGVAAYIEGKADALPDDVKHHRGLLAECRASDDKVVEQQWAFNRNWTPTGWFDKANARNGAAWLRTIVDFAVAYEDYVVEIVDWKTGKQYGHNAEQVELFALSAMRYFRPATKIITRLAYLDAGTEAIDEFDAHQQELLITKWEAKVQPMFADTDYMPRPGNHCYRCDFAKSKGGVCRFG